MKLAIAFLLAASTAQAGETAPITPTTGDPKNYFITDNNFAPINSGGVIAAIEADGSVKIDWDTVQRYAHCCQGSPAAPLCDPPIWCDRTTEAIAILMMAVKDGTWKPMKEPK